MRRAYLVAAALALVAGSARAAIPQVISFQGRLANSAGAASGDAVDIVFALYDAESGGAAIWTETHPGVDPDANGLFSVLLGAGVAFASQGVDFTIPLWLGVTVGADLEMTPRFRLAVVPYAMRSASAATADSADALGTVTEAQITTLQADVAANTTAIGGKADTVHSHDAEYVNVAGDTMTGALVLSGDPAAPLEAATRCASMVFA